MPKVQVEVCIYTDGACSGNPGPGGWGAIVAFRRGKNASVYELGGGERATTNNRMELASAIEAYRFLEHRLDFWLKKHPQIDEVSAVGDLLTDSKYVIQGVTEWSLGWEKRGWKTADKKPVANQDLWQQILVLSRRQPGISLKYVPGHSGVEGNERCDEIAVAYSKGEHLEINLYQGPLTDYPLAIF